MHPLDKLLLLGDPRLYEVCTPVTAEDRPHVGDWVAQLHEVMQAIRAKYGFGRGIAAPQLGILKRLIYWEVGQSEVIINPTITAQSDEMFELWDDCMCFPQLFVRVRRHRWVDVQYEDEHGQLHQRRFSDDISELFQHEYDHLNGVLCTMRALDEKAFRWRAV